MNTIATIIQQCLEKAEIKYQYNEETEVFYFSMSGDSSDLDFFIQVRENEYVSFIASLPTAIPKESYSKVCLAINDINAEAMIASLYLNKDTGKLHSQSFAIAPEGTVHEDVIMHNIGVTMCILDSKVKQIFHIAFSESDDDRLAQLLLNSIKEGANGEPICNQSSILNYKLKKNKAMSSTSIINYEKLWNNIKEFSRRAGRTATRPVLLLYYVMKSPDTPKTDKWLIVTSLAYLILPIDILSAKRIPIIGWLDEVVALSVTVQKMSKHITPEMQAKVDTILDKWFYEMDYEWIEE